MAPEVIDEQRRYYEARAGEYDDWFNRLGRYDRGDDATRTWFAEVDEVDAWVNRVGWRGFDVLELASGTGIWTRRLADLGPATIRAVDASPAMFEQLTSNWTHPDIAVETVVADLFSYEPGRQFDRIFFAFWLSHVPRASLVRFFERVASWLSDEGAVVFVDSRREVTSTAHDHVLPDVGDEVMVRRLDDGREFRIVKNFFSPRELVDAARTAGLDLEVRESETYFYVGVARRAR